MSGDIESVLTPKKLYGHCETMCKYNFICMYIMHDVHDDRLFIGLIYTVRREESTLSYENQLTYIHT